MMMAPRAKDEADWMKHSADLVTVGIEARKAAESKNPEKVLELGEQVYNVCTACHMQYIADAVE
jgi:cytochrome c5